MATTTCGHCGIPSHMTLIAYETDQVLDVSFVRGAYRCDNCHEINSARRRAAVPPSSMARADVILSDSATWVPRFVQGKSFPDVPSHIAEVASEAYECLSIGATHGAILLARAVVEATAKHFGIVDGDLFRKIDELESKEVIAKRVARAAHGVRGFGNEMAHGDFEEPVTADEAEETLALMSVVLEDAFQLPSRTDAILANVEARKAARKAQTP